MFWPKHIILFNTNNLEQFTNIFKLTNSLNSLEHGVKEQFFKKLKNKEKDFFFIKVTRVASTSISNCCLIFGNVCTSEGARTIFDFPVVLELVKSLVGL